MAETRKSSLPLPQLFQKKISNQRVPGINGIGSEISDAGFTQNIFINTKLAAKSRSVFRQHRMSSICYDLRFSASPRVNSRQQSQRGGLNYRLGQRQLNATRSALHSAAKP